MTTNQNYHSKGLVLLLALLTAFPPLSIDMYLPAVPRFQALWNQPADIVNLTLAGFFASYGFFLLVYGPLSDRFGRRPPLTAGIAVYIAASILCAMADGVNAMIFFRVLQAAGAASASAVAMAVCKDVYRGHERERILAYIGVIMALAPMVAPTLGGWVMAFMSWRWIFVIQAGIGVVGLIGVRLMPETLPEPSGGGVLHTAGTYLHLFGNARYLGLTLMVSVASIAHFAFIGGSANIYISGFGLSEQEFGYYFALNAAALMAGSMACTKIGRRMQTRPLLAFAFAGILLGGILMSFEWCSGPWRLALPMALASFAFGLSRPPSNNLILEQVDRHAGAASSLMVFTYFTVGGLAMWGVSLEWEDTISTIGLCTVICAGTVLALWLALPAKTFFKPRDT